jgi:hypothetical protein
VAERRLYAYRIVLTLPKGADAPGWEPEDWIEICEEKGWWSSMDTYGNDEPPPFRWPRRTMYFDGPSAEKRAELLRRYGATVEVERSEPLRWSQGDPLEGANCSTCGGTADDFHVPDALWALVGLGHVQVCFRCFRLAAWDAGVRSGWEVVARA